MSTYDIFGFAKLIDSINSEAKQITGSPVRQYTSDFVFENELEKEFTKSRRTGPEPPQDVVEMLLAKVS